MDNKNIRLTISNIDKYFGVNENRCHILSNISLEICNGEFVCIFGPNGCGKTTLINIIANIIKPDSGQVIHNPNHDGKVGMVFQNYDKTLLPWRRCIDNITLPLESSNL